MSSIRGPYRNVYRLLGNGQTVVSKFGHSSPGVCRSVRSRNAAHMGFQYFGVIGPKKGIEP